MLSFPELAGTPEVPVGTNPKEATPAMSVEEIRNRYGLDKPVQQANATNPKESIGLAKIPLHLWSPLASAYGSLGLLNGGKYGYGNYKATPVLASIYISATERHFSAWKEGQECDPADGVPHLAAVLANIAILLESRAVGTMIDDRQITGGYLKEIEKLTEIANSVQKLHSHLKPKHYTIKDSPEAVLF